MTDYWLSKMMFDLQKSGDVSSWRADREPFLEQYPISEEMKQAVRDDNLAGNCTARKCLPTSVLLRDLWNGR